MTEANGGRPTSEERIARQTLDQGDPDDTVWRGTGGSYKSLRYHDDAGCPYLQQSDDQTDLTRSNAQARWMAPCLPCVIGWTRQDLYRGLLSAIGRYFFHYARNPETGETVEFDADEPYRPILDWVMAGHEPVVFAFHVWGVGGGRGEQFSYHYCKDRQIEWDAEAHEWVVETSAKYVIEGDGSVPLNTPTVPRWPDAADRRVSV